MNVEGRAEAPVDPVTDPPSQPVGSAEESSAATGGACGASAAWPGVGAREFLKALAGEQRQAMLEQFAGGAELAVGTVAERLGVAQPTASQQLALLRRGGLLASRGDGKQVHYRLDIDAAQRSLTELQHYLRTCCPPSGVPLF